MYHIKEVGKKSYLKSDEVKWTNNPNLAGGFNYFESKYIIMGLRNRDIEAERIKDIDIDIERYRLNLNPWLSFILK